jgi:hypothetical protein
MEPTDMLMYWILFLVPAIAVLTPGRYSPTIRNGAWLLVGAFFAVVIGLRHEVGGDWFNYLPAFNEVAGMSFGKALRYNDPGYYGLGWLIAHWGGDLYVLDLVCAALVMYGVAVFARAQPSPWLALLVAVPYLIVVVAMGYTRQSVALGLVLVGLPELARGKTLRYVCWVLLGALFHKSAVLLLPIAALAASKRRIWTAVWVAVTTATGAALLLLDQSDALWHNYVEANYQSQGGQIRVAMNAVPALILLLFRRRIGVPDGERKLWFWIAIFSLACLPLVQYSSTAVDRVALYFIPIQMFVFSRVPRLAATEVGRTAFVLGTIAYSAIVLFVWLNYANFASYWLPYRFMPMDI